MTWRSMVFLCVITLLSMVAAAAQAEPSESFDTWLTEFHEEAVAKGIPEPVVTRTLANLVVDDEVIALDQKQPEDKATFTQYLRNTQNKKRIAKGRALLKEHHVLLKKISHYYRVQPQYIVALWGMETDYGAHQGNFQVVRSLATLAYEGRRADLFKEELIQAMRIIARKHIAPEELTGSWAGAMGNCQFMPSSYLKFAVDWNHDGHTDIWNSTPDTLASIAKYLHESGWNHTQGWGSPVPLDTPAPPEADLVTPGEEEEGTFSVTDNYHVLLKWNRSRYFAIATGLLADKLVE